MESDLRSLLLANPTLTALVGNKIYWDEIPQTTKRPAIVMYLVSGLAGYHAQGADGLNTTRVQFDCQSLVVSEKWAIARALEDALSGFRGIQGDTQFQGMFKSLERDKAERPATPAATFFVRQLDFEIWWRVKPPESLQTSAPWDDTLVWRDSVVGSF